MIEIVDACTKSGNEWCTCCQKQTDTKRIKFSYDGRQGNSVVLCDDCRRELARTIQAIPLDAIKQTVEVLDNTYEGLDGYDPDALGAFKCKVNEVFDKLLESGEENSRK